MNGLAKQNNKTRGKNNRKTTRKIHMFGGLCLPIQMRFIS